MKKPVYIRSLAFFILTLLFLWGVCAWILFSGHVLQPACHESYRNDKLVSVGSQSLKLQVATTDQEQMVGLGGRKCIASDQGMLFIFDKAGYYPFWMKNMRFPIDIIWLSDSKQVVYMQKNLAPSTYPKSFTNPTPVHYVIELQAGKADSLDIKSGTKLNF
jgi:uncharacterized membrane protein (UPF0127 family)